MMRPMSARTRVAEALAPAGSRPFIAAQPVVTDIFRQTLDTEVNAATVRANLARIKEVIHDPTELGERDVDNLRDRKLVEPLLTESHLLARSREDREREREEEEGDLFRGEQDALSRGIAFPDSFQAAPGARPLSARPSAKPASNLPSSLAHLRSELDVDGEDDDDDVDLDMDDEDIELAGRGRPRTAGGAKAAIPSAYDVEDSVYLSDEEGSVLGGDKPKEATKRPVSSSAKARLSDAKEFSRRFEQPAAAPQAAPGAPAAAAPRSAHILAQPHQQPPPQQQPSRKAVAASQFSASSAAVPPRPSSARTRAEPPKPTAAAARAPPASGPVYKSFKVPSEMAARADEDQPARPSSSLSSNRPPSATRPTSASSSNPPSLPVAQPLAPKPLASTLRAKKRF